MQKFYTFIIMMNINTTVEAMDETEYDLNPAPSINQHNSYITVGNDVWRNYLLN